jgi:quercetin dioxygenase-like cupin family protein
MTFIDTDKLEVFEKGTGGWKGRQFRSPSMTFVHWEFEAGASVHEHFHVQEEVWEVTAGVLEITIGGVSGLARPGNVAIVPPNVPHSVRALEAGSAIVIDHPIREGF